MIKSINLKNCTPYNCAEITDCKSINFIFGSNGSGKSTVSSFLAGASDVRYSESSIDWYSENHETICVYNKNFRKENFKQTIPGVFTLGNGTIEDIENLEKLKADHGDLLKEIAGLSGSLDKKEEEIANRNQKFAEDVWRGILKKYEADFQKAFDGFRGNKEKFRFELERRFTEKAGNVCVFDDLKKRAKALYSGKMSKCPSIALEIDDFCKRIIEIKNDPIWSVSIIGNDDVDIAALIKKFDNSSWVNQGLKYLDENSSVCPFCQQETITNDFRKKIEEFFNEEYSNNVAKINNLKQEYIELCNKIKAVIGDSVPYGEPTTSEVSGLDFEDFQNKLLLLQSAIEKDSSEISKKINNPETKIEIVGIGDEIDRLKAIICEANERIDKHNLLVDNQKAEEEQLTNDIWASCIHWNESIIKRFLEDSCDLKKGFEGIKKARDEKRKKALELENLIVEKGKSITSVQPTVDEINRSLKAYGFDSFSIQKAGTEDNYYCIKRKDGSPAEGTLSEGEETFLTFLYFMQMTKGSSDPEHVSDEKIIVLDDPISSLDSNILYVVGALVKNLTKDIKKGIGNVKQLFVLTHNVFFHKEASFIDGRSKECDDVNYWIIRKDEGISTIKSYGRKNPISTSYQLLWAELKEGGSLITIQNTMRRIIENYFGIIGGRLDEKLIDGFETIEEKTIARSLLYWINDGSHSIPDDLYIDSFTDAVPKYKSVFKELFVRSNHLAHYNMMMGIDD
ncbi:MAG: AAA family ATPase [Bacilli bacterium]|nr:AAA family ATPase [Bacilli bacterium]